MNTYCRCFISIVLLASVVLAGCTAVNTFPSTARAGDTLAVMVGGSEKARKETVSVTLTDAMGAEWDLQALGKVRSVFNVRPDGVSHGLHYSQFLDSTISWSKGHEPLQTVMVIDIPSSAAPGAANLTISLNVDDNSSLVTDPITMGLDIVSGAGEADELARQDPFAGSVAADLSRLEPAPYAKLTVNSGSGKIGALSAIIDFDATVLDPGDVNVYVPEAVVRGSVSTPGPFGGTQRMVYWRQEGGQVHVSMVAPQGLDREFVQIYIVHPRGLSGPPNFTITNTNFYDIDGELVSFPLSLEYFP
jgi:hypothetical protein